MRANSKLHLRAFRGISDITHIPILSIVSNFANILVKGMPQTPPSNRTHALTTATQSDFHLRNIVAA